MGIFEDSIRRKLGFETKSEQLDRQINNYQLRDYQALEHSIAIRNMDISYYTEQLRQVEQTIKDNQVFIDAYESIKEAAIKKVSLGTSTIKDNILDSKGNIIAAANYCALASYYRTYSNSNKSPQEIMHYSMELAIILEKMWQMYVTRVIIGNGAYPIGEGEFADGMEIMTIYTKTLEFMLGGNMRDENRSAVILNERFMPFITKAHNEAERVNIILSSLMQQINNSLRLLNQEQALDEHAKNIIDETKTALKSTKEYFEAQKSKEYLDTLDQITGRK